MTNREKVYAMAEGKACHYSKNRSEWLEQYASLPKDVAEEFERELWRAYRAAFIDGTEWTKDLLRTAMKEIG